MYDIWDMTSEGKERRLCARAFDESIERNRHHCCSCKGERASTTIREVVEKQGTCSESPLAFVFIMCIVLEFITCPEWSKMWCLCSERAYFHRSLHVLSIKCYESY
jgi:hypothetical protein